MKDRDKLLIVVVLLVAVCLLPYFLFISPEKEKITNMENQIIQANDRYNQLLAYEENRDFYKEQTKALSASTNEIIAQYPADIDAASFTMYLLTNEYSESVVTKSETEEGGRIESVEPTVRYDDVVYSENIYNPIGNEDVVTGYTSVENTSVMSFICMDNDAVNHMLEYIIEYVDPMTFPVIEFKRDPDKGHITGEVTLVQYAIAGGEDREFERLPIIPDIDSQGVRGNDEYGVFGPNKLLLEEELREAAEAEAEAAAAADEE